MDWYKHKGNESYIYYNCADSKWWLEGPDGSTVYTNSLRLSHCLMQTYQPRVPPESGWKLVQSHVIDKSLPGLYMSGSLADFFENL